MVLRQCSCITLCIMQTDGVSEDESGKMIELPHRGKINDVEYELRIRDHALTIKLKDAIEREGSEISKLITSSKLTVYIE